MTGDVLAADLGYSPLHCLHSMAEDIARLKGHDRTMWMFAGLFFGPIALLALAAYPDLEDRKHQRNAAAELSLIKDDIDAMRRGKD